MDCFFAFCLFLLISTGYDFWIVSLLIVWLYGFALGLRIVSLPIVWAYGFALGQSVVSVPIVFAYGLGIIILNVYCTYRLCSGLSQLMSYIVRCVLLCLRLCVFH